MEDEFSLVDEFSVGVSTSEQNPLLVAMANSKWQSKLYAALALSKDEIQTPEEACIKLKSISLEIANRLSIPTSDKPAINLILQSTSDIAAEEIERSGKLEGDWINRFTESLRSMPFIFKIYNNPNLAASSLGMTLANHYAELFEIANDFSFLRQPSEVVGWAHEEIHSIAQKNADALGQDGDTTAIYQNQLNSLRKVFLSVYQAEAREWKPMLTKQPSLQQLCAGGLPLEGVEEKFSEQAKALQKMIGILPGEPKDMRITR